MIKPLHNCVLIEVLNEFEGLVGATDENMQCGKLMSFQLIADHLTASAGYHIDPSAIKDYSEQLNNLGGKIVYWQEYADSGSKFKHRGKEYVLIPFYRIIGFEEAIKEEK